MDPCEFKSSLVYIVSLGHQSYQVRYNTAEKDVYHDENRTWGRDREQRDGSQVQGCQGSCWALAETRGGLSSCALAENRALALLGKQRISLGQSIFPTYAISSTLIVNGPQEATVTTIFSSHCVGNLRASENIFQLISLLVT